MVLRVSNSISRGKFETAVTAQWQFAGGAPDKGTMKEYGAVGLSEKCSELTAGLDAFDPSDANEMTSADMAKTDGETEKEDATKEVEEVRTAALQDLGGAGTGKL